jgi:uncharacterized damage-inducible protein DinB
MNALFFQKLYEYHFFMNKKFEEAAFKIEDKEFQRKYGYSLGSLINICVHLFNVEVRWFSWLRGEKIPGFENPVYYGKKEKIRLKWVEVEKLLRGYLQSLTDKEVVRKLDNTYSVWQVLFHVINHATDHRSQGLALLHELNGETFPQDYAIFLERRK